MLVTKDLLSVRSEERSKAEKMLKDKIQEKKKMEETLERGENAISMVGSARDKSILLAIDFPVTQKKRIKSVTELSVFCRNFSG